MSDLVDNSEAHCSRRRQGLRVELVVLHAKVAVIIQQGLCARVRVITGQTLTFMFNEEVASKVHPFTIRDLRNPVL
ncbi:MAG: hypothetical protein FRX49_06630 [Trebouxia sp. A1-2]|nr:MAG: hypothetical protein FRX49_06630 [Trebouxia sp. A1-2]